MTRIECHQIDKLELSNETKDNFHRTLIQDTQRGVKTRSSTWKNFILLKIRSTEWLATLAYYE